MYCTMRFHKDHDMDLIDSTVDMVKESLLKESNELSTLRILLNKTEVGGGLFYYKVFITGISKSKGITM